MYHPTRLSASGSAVTDTPLPQLSDLESQAVNNPQVTNTEQGPVGTPVTTLHDRNNPFTSEDDDSAEAGQLAGVREHGLNDVPLARPRRTWMFIAALIAVILFLIALPGIILGAVTRKIVLGLAISGAVAPAVVFFGGLYYHHNR